MTVRIDHKLLAVTYGVKALSMSTREGAMTP